MTFVSLSASSAATSANYEGKLFGALITNSPFGRTADSPEGKITPDVEFRGYVVEEGKTIFSIVLAQGDRSRSYWLRVGGACEDLVVLGFDQEREELQISNAGRQSMLLLKRARVRLLANRDDRSENPPTNKTSSEVQQPHEMVAAEIRRRRALRQEAEKAQSAESQGN